MEMLQWGLLRIFFRLNNLNFLSLSSQQRCSSPLTTVVTLLLTCSNSFMSFLYFLVHSELDAAAGGTSPEWRWKTLPTHNPLDTLPLKQTRILLAFWAASAQCRFIQIFLSTSIPKCFSIGLLSIPSPPACVDVGDCPNPGGGPCSWPCGTSWAHSSRLPKSRRSSDSVGPVDIVYFLF